MTFFVFRYIAFQQNVAYSNSNKNNHNNNNIGHNSKYGLFENMAWDLKAFPIGKKSVKIKNRYLTSWLYCTSDEESNTIEILTED